MLIPMGKRVILDLNNMYDAEFYRQLLVNIYKAADYLGERADSRSRDFSRDNNLRSKDRGIADAHENIQTMILHYDTIGKTDYYKANKVVKDLPNILK